MGPGAAGAPEDGGACRCRAWSGCRWGDPLGNGESSTEQPVAEHPANGHDLHHAGTPDGWASRRPGDRDPDWPHSTGMAVQSGHRADLRVEISFGLNICRAARHLRYAGRKEAGRR